MTLIKKIFQTNTPVFLFNKLMKSTVSKEGEGGGSVCDGEYVYTFIRFMLSKVAKPIQYCEVLTLH